MLAGRCDREQIVPYQPFAEALKHLVAAIPAGPLRAITGSWAPDLARLVPQLGDRLRDKPRRKPRGTGCSKGSWQRWLRCRAPRRWYC